MEHIHQIIKCKHCGDVILQCRCTDVDKTITFAVCNSCQTKAVMSEFTVTVEFERGVTETIKVYAVSEEEAISIAGARFRLEGRKVLGVTNERPE